LSAAITGKARVNADAHSPPLTKGFNLNIPYLHEVKYYKFISSLTPLRPRIEAGGFLRG